MRLLAPRTPGALNSLSLGGGFSYSPGNQFSIYTFPGGQYAGSTAFYLPGCTTVGFVGNSLYPGKTASYLEQRFTAFADIRNGSFIFQRRRNIVCANKSLPGYLFGPCSKGMDYSRGRCSILDYFHRHKS